MGDELLIAVGADNALHSSVWHAWSHRDDLYLAQVTLHPKEVVTKLSVHTSGICRFATHRKGGRPFMDIAWDADKDPRVARRWQIDPVSKNRLCWCAHLVVPNIEIEDRFQVAEVAGSARASQTVLARQEEVGRACVVSFARAPTASVPLDGFVTMDHEVLGFLDLQSGSRVWAIRTSQRVLEHDLNNWRRLRDQSQFVAAAPAPGRFGSLLKLDGDQAPVLFEVALGKRNFIEDDGHTPDPLHADSSPRSELGRDRAKRPALG